MPIKLKKINYNDYNDNFIYLFITYLFVDKNVFSWFGGNFQLRAEKNNARRNRRIWRIA